MEEFHRTLGDRLKHYDRRMSKLYKILEKHHPKDPTDTTLSKCQEELEKIIALYDKTREEYRTRLENEVCNCFFALLKTLNGVAYTPETHDSIRQKLLEQCGCAILFASGPSSSACERVYIWEADPPYADQGWKDEVALFTKNREKVIDEQNIMHFIEKEKWHIFQ